MEKRTKITVRDLNLYYGENHALKDVNMNIRENCVTAFIGPSGCGKSTFLKTLNRMNDLVDGVRITGEVKLDDEDIYAEGVDTTVLRKRIGMVFQQPNPFPMSIYDNIAYGLKVKKVSKAEIHERVSHMLSLIRLDGYEKRKPAQLSGGQKQRVSIARALINNPKVLLLDEPLGALDLNLRKQMQLELKTMQKKLGITFIYITHDQEEALTMSDTIVVMNQGYIQQIGTPQEVFNHPANLFVAGFIGTPQMNFFDVRLKRENNEVVAYFGDNKIVVPQGKVSKFVDESYVGREVVMGIRPENIHDDEMFLANAADAAIDVKVEVTEKMGSETYLYLTTTGKEGNIIARVNPRTTSVAGAEIKVAFDVNHLHFFDKETARTILVSDAVPAPTKTNLTK